MPKLGGQVIVPSTSQHCVLRLTEELVLYILKRSSRLCARQLEFKAGSVVVIKASYETMISDHLEPGMHLLDELHRPLKGFPILAWDEVID